MMIHLTLNLQFFFVAHHLLHTCQLLSCLTAIWDVQEDAPLPAGSLG